ncbi:MAG: hypothetical protein K0U93_04770 [Gammaproteobacteria bacterium]|nr:hypothetical protein [Gammaproteobacteria bacterium]
MFSNLQRFEPHLPNTCPRCISDLPTALRMFEDQALEIWFTPNPLPSHTPKLWILGITPGWQQMRIAYEEAALALNRGQTPAQAIAKPKPNVSFAGSMRANLIAMLNALGVQRELGVSDAAQLFGSDLLRTGSVLRFPIFVKGKNYTGHAPNPLRHPALKRMLDEVWIPEMHSVGNCLILPLGRAVEQILSYATNTHGLDAQRVLSGFPHPSGANGHRRRQFAQAQKSLTERIDTWFTNHRN